MTVIRKSAPNDGFGLKIKFDDDVNPVDYGK